MRHDPGAAGLDAPDTARLRAAVVAVLRDRSPASTACPSEVARRIDPVRWRDLMDAVRDAAAELADDGTIEVTQRGEPVDARDARGPIRLRRGPAWDASAAPDADPAGPGDPDAGPPARTHWLLPVQPAAHPEHLPADWRTRPDAGPVWAAIGRSQDPSRWCLRSGFRTMRPGDTLWAYLAVRQELCAVGVVRDVVRDRDGWSVLVDWDAGRTAALGDAPIPRAAFGQVPMSTCRARPSAAAVLEDRWGALGRA